MFLNDWAKAQYEGGLEGLDALLDSFDITIDVLEGVKILLASYTYEQYEGNAFVLFEKDGKLYEVNGSHCSCYELEGQWEPEETSKQALLYRLDNGRLGVEYDKNVFAQELRQLLEIL